MITSDIFAYQSTSVDFLTVTSKDIDGLAAINDAYKALTSQMSNYDRMCRVWRFKGFSGESCGSVRQGLREDGWAILMVSGGAAHEASKILEIKDANVTRLDLQVTVKFEVCQEHYARGVFNLLTTGGVGKTKNVSSRFITSSSKGETVYIGSRTSQQMARIYDKGIESDLAPAGFLWRYEVEFKKPLASRVFSTIQASEAPNLGIPEIVYHWLLKRGVKPTWPISGDAPIVEVAWKAKSLERTLSWLRTQVRPTVLRLLDAGNLQDVENALQLSIDGHKSDHE